MPLCPPGICQGQFCESCKLFKRPQEIKVETQQAQENSFEVTKTGFVIDKENAQTFENSPFT